MKRLLIALLLIPALALAANNWRANGGGGGGGGTPGGSNTQVQFNNSGNFGGSANFTWDGTNLNLTGGLLGGPNLANLPFIGSPTLSTAGANASFNLWSAFSFGNQSEWFAARANGTGASPTHVSNPNTLLRIGVRGYGATGYSSSDNGAIDFIATQDWTDSANGLKVAICTTPNGSTICTTAITLDQDQSATFAGVINGNGSGLTSIPLSAGTGYGTGVKTFLATPSGANFNSMLSSPCGPAKGCTGVANDALSLITISGAFPFTATLTASTNVTFPTSGTVYTSANSIATGSQTVGGLGWISSTASQGTLSFSGAITGPVCGNNTSAPALCGAGTVTGTMMASTAVTPAAYTNANITIDQQGRITAAANGSAGTTITAAAIATILASTPATGTIDQATDLKYSLWIYNGTRWKPLNGTATLCSLDSTQSHTGDNTKTVLTSCSIPPGVVQNGDRLRVRASIAKTGTAVNCTAYLLLGTAGTTADTELANDGGALATSNTNYGSLMDMRRESATSVQTLGVKAGAIFQNSYESGALTGTLPAAITVSSMDSNTMKLSEAVQLSGAATDTCQLRDWTVDLVSSSN